jgi:DNA-binding LacI/PurR family transcriptional regulator
MLYEGDGLARAHGPQPNIFQLPVDEQSGRADFLAWIKVHRPDAIVSCNNTPWPWLQAEFPELRRPGFISLYNQGLAYRPGIAHLRRHHEDEGRQAVDLLDFLIRHQQQGPSKYPLVVNIAPEWVPGASLRRKRTSR